MTIGLSKQRPNYAEWLRSMDQSVEVVDLYNAPDASAAMDECDALILTGGDDVNPATYDRPDDRPLCTEVDDRRDELEVKLFTRARETGKPVLGICRGLQIINVACGGSLYADIYQQAGSTTVHTKDQTTKVDAVHEVSVSPGSLLHKIVRSSTGEINSAHHQSARDIAPELRVTARAADGIVEALEWKDTMGKPFMLAVQWHPERMNRESAFALNVLKHFLFEVESRKMLNV